MAQTMKCLKNLLAVVARLMVASRVCAESSAAADEAAHRSLQVELPNQDQNAIKTSWPAIGCWFPQDQHFKLPATMKELTGDNVAGIVSHLKAAGIERQTQGNGHQRLSGHCRLLDGTVILASGEKDVLGDPIQKTLDVDGHEVAFDAVGVAAVRLDKDGKLEALAAGGLKRFAVGTTKIELPQRIDVALWKDTKGVWQGVLQDYEGEVPKDLATLCKHWTRLKVPEPLKE